MKRKYGNGVTADSGTYNRRLGGDVSQKNGVVRVRVKPTYPRTEKQSAQLALIPALGAKWKTTLTEAQRTDFGLAAKSGEWQRQDDFYGTSVNFTSGFELYQALSLIASTANGTATFLTQARKGVQGTAAVNEILLEAEASAFMTMTMSYTGALAANEKFVIKASPVKSPGKMAFRKNGLRIITVSNAASAIDLQAAYETAFPGQTPSAGEKVDYQIVIANSATGESRIIAQGTAIVQAG